MVISVFRFDMWSIISFRNIFQFLFHLFFSNKCFFSKFLPCSPTFIQIKRFLLPNLHQRFVLWHSPRLRGFSLSNLCCRLLLPLDTPILVTIAPFQDQPDLVVLSTTTTSVIDTTHNQNPQWAWLTPLPPHYAQEFFLF